MFMDHGIYPDINSSFFCKLYGIIYKVSEDLVKLFNVSFKNTRCFWIEFNDKLQFFSTSHGLIIGYDIIYKGIAHVLACIDQNFLPRYFCVILNVLYLMCKSDTGFFQGLHFITVKVFLNKRCHTIYNVDGSP